METKKSIVKTKEAIEEFEIQYPEYKWIIPLYNNRIRTGDPNDRTLTIDIQNTSDKEETLILFGAIKDPYNNFNTEKIKINVSESSYETLKADLLSSIFLTKIIQIDVMDKNQFNNPLHFYHESTTGAAQGLTIWPDGKMYHPIKSGKVKFLGEYDKNERTFYDTTVYLFDKYTYLQMRINPHEKMRISISLLARIGAGLTELFLQEPANSPYEEYDFKSFSI